MKKLLPILTLFFCFTTKAQYVTIPDTVFVAWLQSNGYAGCMSGNQLDTTCSGVLSANIMNCYAVPIHDLTGIQYFKNLTSLDCSNDSLYIIPALPSKLSNLNCGQNNLSSLPALPDSLFELFCYSNQLTSLPALPNSLSHIECDHNKLSSLPMLPSALTNLQCDENQLISLPPLPSSLVYLDCEINQLTNLPPLPASLQSFYCSWNQLDSLPPLPASLRFLKCNNNHLVSLPFLPAVLGTLDCDNDQLSNLPALPASLTYLYCYQNNLTSLPTLPASLSVLWCYRNQLSSLPALSSALNDLECYNNQLTALPALPSALNTLACSFNQLTNMPSLPTTLQTLLCDNNQLTALPGLPSALVMLYCNDNQLTAIPALPDSLYEFYCHDNPNLNCLPELKRIVRMSFGPSITCLPNYGNVTGSAPPLNSLPLCGIFNPSGCQRFWNISGQCYYDENHDCSFDSIDVGTNYVKTELYSGGSLVQQTYSGGEGFYSFNVSNGNYKVLVDTSTLPFVVECPAVNYYNDTISATDSLSYNNNFAFKCRTVGFDLGAQSMVYTGIPRPAATFALNTIAGDMSELYGAHCASGTSGQVQIIFNGPIAYVSLAAGALTPTTVSGDTVTWSIADFGVVNNSTVFNLLFKVDSLATAGSPVCFTVNVTPTAGDYNPSNNSLTYCFSVVNSLDPNEKEVYPSGNVGSGQWLTYTIRFQNTGTAAAENIRVSDTLNANLNPATFQLLTFSAKNIVQIVGNVVNVYFPNINLADSLTSDSLSTGYIQYRIQPYSSLPSGAVISNSASIYFDLNPPVVTNTVSDTIINGPACIPVYTNLSETACGSYSFNGQTLTTTGTYTDTLTAVSGCDSIVTLALTVNPLPVVNPVSNITVCAGDTVGAIQFSGTAGAAFNWTNSDTAIGLSAGGAGNIPLFTAANNNSSAVTATVTVTPQTVSNQKAYIGNAASNTVSVIDVATGLISATITGVDDPFGVAVSPDGTRVYVTNNIFAAGDVTVINAVTNTIITSIPVGEYPCGIVISPDGNWLYVANTISSSVSVISTATNAVTATIPTEFEPLGIAITPDGKTVYTINDDFGEGFTAIATATNTVSAHITGADGGGEAGLAITPDGNFLYGSANQDDYIAVVNTADNLIQDTIHVGIEPTGVAVSPDGKYVYVACEATDSLYVIATSTNTVVDIIPVGIFGCGVSVTPDGSQVYVNNVTSNNVMVMSTATNRVIDTIATGTHPFSMGNFISGKAGCTGNPVSFNITVNPLLRDSITATIDSGSIYHFNGRTLTTPGIYKDTLASAITGCDSIVTLKLSVDTPAGCVVDTINQFHSLCAGDSILFYGTWLHTPGQYDTLLHSVTACDTLVILSLVVQDPLPPTRIYDTICSNDSILFNGTYYSTGGVYTGHFSSVSGCDSAVILTLSTKPAPMVTLSWDSMVLLGRFTPYYLNDTVSCYGLDATVVTLVGGLPAGGTYSGYGISNDTFYQAPALNPRGIDTIVYSYTAINGCLSSAYDTIFIDICEGIPTVNLSNAISIYPNPASQLLYIKTENINPQTITLYDVEGQMLSTQNFTHELDISRLTSGVYLLELTAVEGTTRKVWVKE